MKSRARTGRALIWILVLAMLVAAGIRLRLVDVPLERDEGEYAYTAQRMLHGVPPFAQSYNMKMPGIYAAYAGVLAVFGQTHRGVHLSLILINALTTLLLFALFRRLFDREIAVLGAAGFALLSLVPQAQGIMANAEHFVLLFALAGLVVLVEGIEARNHRWLFASSLLLGVAFLMKQHAVFYAAYGGLLLVLALVTRLPGTRPRRAATGALFLVGVATPFGLTCLALWFAGVFDRFWFWTFEYGRSYVSQVPLADGIDTLGRRIAGLFGDSPLFWLLAPVGLVSPLWQRRKKETLIALYAFVVFALLATCPGFFFRKHYFLLFLPAVGLASGFGVVSLANRIPLADRNRNGTLAVLIGAAVTLQLVLGSPTYFTRTPVQVSRSMYGGNPFPESIEVGRFIRQNSSEEDTIAVLGSEPQIYFYARRRSATGYIYAYALMERHESARGMQEEMIEQIETARPKYIVVARVKTSWLRRSYSEPLLDEWMRRYLPTNYRRVRSYPAGSRRSVLDLWERL